MIDFTELDCLDGLVSDADGRVLTLLALQVPARQVIVEVGSFKGKSSCYMATGASEALNNVPVIAVDAWDTAGNVTGRFGYADPATHLAFIEQVERMGFTHGEEIISVKGFSADVAREWTARGLPDDPIGLLFIDGDHGEENVRRDFLAFRSRLAEAAWVAFDDIDTARNPGVRVVVDELVDRGDLLFIGKPEGTKLAVCARPL